MRVLVVEDDKRLASAVSVVSKPRLRVDLAFDGTDGKWLATEQDTTPSPWTSCCRV